MQGWIPPSPVYRLYHIYSCNFQSCTGTHSSASGLRLQSLERTDLRVRRMRTHFGDRAFSAAGPRCWNSLPRVILFAYSVDSFKAQLKTHLLAKAYPMLVRRPCSGMAALLRHINCRNYYYYYYLGEAVRTHPPKKNREAPMHLSVFTSFCPQNLGLPTQYFRQVFASVQDYYISQEAILVLETWSKYFSLS